MRVRTKGVGGGDVFIVYGPPELTVWGSIWL